MHKRAAIIILFLRFLEKFDAIAAGAQKSAITKIMPTLLIKTTMQSAVRISNKYSKNAVLIPMIFANSASNKNAFQSCQKITIQSKITALNISIK